MHWWDKRDKQINGILNCKVGGYSDEEISENYSDDFCLREEDGRELTVEEAKDWYDCRKILSDKILL